MSLHYSVEKWYTYAPDALPLWQKHWQEVALNQDVIPLDVDTERYAALDAADKLHVVTGRDDTGILRAYHLSFVDTHMHYKSTLHAQLDVYWLDPAYRKGLEGWRLFKVAEETLRIRGVVKLIQGHKMHVNAGIGKLFDRMGYRHIEDTYSKMLK